MNILVTFDSFKGSISSKHANLAVREGLLLASRQFHVSTVPIADGGEGTVEALVEATNGDYKTVQVTGSLGEMVTAKYGILGDGKTAVIEIAEACGLPLLPVEKRNPLYITTYGVGEIILDGIENGCREFIIGLGGSATNDAGVGMLQALGFQFFDAEGLEIQRGGRSLSTIMRIDSSNVPNSIKEAIFHVACDVKNPLYGENGAAFIFGPQKGATSEMVELLDQGLRHFSEVVKKQFNINLQGIPGAGAAGGLGVAFAGFLNAKLLPGVELVLETIQLEEMLNDVDLVITGEGRLDHQTVFGKTPAGIAKAAKKHNIPVVAIAGDISKADQSLHDNGIDAYFSIVSGPISLENAMDPVITRNNLIRTGEQIGRLIHVFVK